MHELIKNDIALYVAHTNADVANPGVSDALAAGSGCGSAAAVPDSTDAAGRRGLGRVGELAAPMTLAEFADHAARVLPRTAAGVRAPATRSG